MSTLINTFRAGFTVDPAALEREVGKTIARHELYDELDACNKAETRLFELVLEQDKDEVLKAIGRIVWDAFDRVVKREIDTMNEQIAEQSARNRAEV
jgi:N-methylhydantoinase B/oxoprolinase/acetone carboxylase alpha subunit